MHAQSSFTKIREALAQVQAQGQQSVDIKALLTFLDSVEKEAPLEAEVRKLNHESQLAHYKAQRETDLAYYKATVESETEMFRSVVETAKTALSTSILVNGGATVALLAFLGNAIGKSTQATSLQSLLVSSLVGFALGVLLGAMASGSTYLAQFCYHQEHKRSGIAFHVAAVVLVLASYGAFAAGAWGAYHAFK